MPGVIDRMMPVPDAASIAADARAGAGASAAGRAAPPAPSCGARCRSSPRCVAGGTPAASSPCSATRATATWTSTTPTPGWPRRASTSRRTRRRSQSLLETGVWPGQVSPGRRLASTFASSGPHAAHRRGASVGGAGWVVGRAVSLHGCCRCDRSGGARARCFWGPCRVGGPRPVVSRCRYCAPIAPGTPWCGASAGGAGWGVGER